MEKSQNLQHNCKLQLYEALEDLVTSAEAIDYLELPPGKTGTRATLLGLQPENLMKSDKQLRSLQQVRMDVAQITIDVLQMHRQSYSYSCLTLSAPAILSVCKFSLCYPHKISWLVMRIKQLILQSKLSWMKNKILPTCL